MTSRLSWVDQSVVVFGRKSNKIKHQSNFHYLQNFFYIIICYCCRDSNSIIMESLNFSNILFRKSYYTIESSSFCQLFFGSCPVARSSGDHVDHPYSQLIIYSFLNLRLRSSIDRRLCHRISLVLFKIASSNQDFYLDSELNALFDIVTMIMMKPIIFPSIVVPRQCFHRWRVL